MTANRGMVCGLMPYPALVRELLEGIFSQLDMQLSIKTRIGHSHSEEIFEMLEVFADFSIRQVIIHPRTGKQKWQGQVDTESFAAITQQTTLPLALFVKISFLEEKPLEMKLCHGGD